MLADEKTKKEVKDVLNLYSKYYDEKDIKSIMGLFAEYDDSIFIGTDEDEFLQGLDELKKGLQHEFQQSDSIKINWGPLNVFKSGKIAWLASTMQMVMKREDGEIELNGRATFILEKMRING